MALHVQHEGPASVYGRVGPLFCIAWRGQPTAEDVEAFKAWTESVVVDLPAYVVIAITPLMKPPDAETRRRIAEAAGRPPANFRGTSVVIEADGFAGSMMRAVLAGMNFITGRVLTEHVARTVDEALAHVERLAPVDHDACVAGLAELKRRARS